MQTIGDYIDEVQSRYSKGVKSTDSRLVNRIIYSKLKDVRSSLIREKSNKKQSFSNVFYQLLPGVEMEQVSTSVLPTIVLSNKTLRTKVKLPAPIYDANGPLISSVSNIEGTVLYNKTTWQTIKNAKGRKYSPDKPNYFLLDDYLYINGKASPRATAINYISEDPISSWLYPVYEDCTINCTLYMDIPFPVDEDMGNTIIEMTAKHFIDIYSQRKDDREQNDIDNT